MADHPRLSRAPIIEALIDFRVEPDPTLRVPDLRQIQLALGTEAFPEVAPQRQTTVQLSLDATSEAKQVQDVGYLLRGADGLHVVQVQHGGFTFSRLKPYADWNELLAGARDAWAKYVAIAKPRRVTRVAVRTINRLELPLPVGDLRDWVRTVPDIPSTLPQGISEMFCRMALPMRDGAVVILTQALEPMPLGAERCGVILDIDVFRVAELSFSGDAPWAALAPMRQLKNDFFFECVTPRTLELCK